MSTSTALTTLTGDSNRQWLRDAEVVVGKGGTGISIKDARIVFEVVKTLESAPNTAVIKIYNLSPDNENKIKNEFDEVLLNAGYQGSSLLVFRGNIKHVYRYREGNDYITEIDAADGDKDFRSASMNETLAAGTSTAQLVDRAVASFQGVGGTTKGVIQAPGGTRLRGKVISGNTRDILDDIAAGAGANWSIQDGALHIVSTNGVAPGVAILLTSDTGLLGAPEINDKGIAVKCYLNPQIKINGAVNLNNNGIKAKHLKAAALGKNIEAEKNPVRLDPDGIYKVIKLTHKGDTRGSDYFTESTCIGLDQPIPKSTP